VRPRDPVVTPAGYKKETCRSVMIPSRPMDKEGYNGYITIVGNRRENHSKKSKNFSHES